MNFLIVVGEIVVKSTAIALICALAALTLKRRSAVIENTLWRVGLVAMVGVALWTVGATLPSQTTVVPAFYSPVINVPAPSQVAKDMMVEPAAPPTSADRVSVSNPVDWNHVAVGLYGLGAALSLLWLVVGLVRARRMIGEATAYRDEIASAPQGVRLLISRDIAVPATFGARRPVILLSEAISHGTQERLAIVVAHERTHIFRGDWAWQIAAQILRASLWFSPAAWIIPIGLQDSAERAADDRVVGNGFNPEVYAKELIAMAAMRSPGSSLVAITRGRLKGRLHRILHNEYPPAPARKATGLIAVGILGISSIAIAGVSVRILSPKSADGSFYGPVQLRSGALVRIVSVRQKNRSWAPNGTPTHEEPLETEGPEGQYKGPFNALPAVQLQLDGRFTQMILFPDPPAYNLSHFSRVKGDPGKTNMLFALLPRNNEKVVDFKLALGSMPLHPKIDCRPNEGPLFAHIAANLKGGVTVQASPPPLAPYEQVNIAIVTKKGTKRFGEFRHLAAPTPQGQAQVLDYSFPNVKPEDIVRVQLWTQDLQWVTFKGIHLTPKSNK